MQQACSTCMCIHAYMLCNAGITYIQNIIINSLLQLGQHNSTQQDNQHGGDQVKLCMAKVVISLMEGQKLMEVIKTCFLLDTACVLIQHVCTCTHTCTVTGGYCCPYADKKLQSLFHIPHRVISNIVLQYTLYVVCSLITRRTNDNTTHNACYSGICGLQ